MKSAIQQRARELGFDDCRFTSALPPATAPHFAAWLAARRHGEMGYLARNAAKRVDPQSVLPGAKTIISLAVAYAGDEPPSPTHSAVAQVNPQERPRAKRLDCIAMSPAAPSPPSAGERVGVRIPRNQYSRIEPLNQLAAPLLLPLLGGESRGEGERPTDIPVHGKGPLKVADSNARSATPPGTDSRGVVARYARFADYHDVLGRQLKLLSEWVNETGGPGTRSLWYVDTGPVLERDLAQRAGLGFIGKHTNLISRRLGNWIFLSEILTTLELAPDAPEPNRCGSCARCLAACPTGAITAPFQLDARRCISYLTIELKGPIPVELRPAIGNRIYGCDDCLAVCPWNRFAREGKIMAAHARPDLAAPDLLALLALDEPGFRQRFQGTPLWRTKRRGLLRNVCVALGNAGDPAALPALARAAADPEPLIAEHARWAIERIAARPR